MLGYPFTLLRDVRVDANVEIWAIGILAGDFVEEIGESEDVVFVAHHPVKIYSAMMLVWRRLSRGLLGGSGCVLHRLYAFELVVLEVSP
jgi:hypothetical protein